MHCSRESDNSKLKTFKLRSFYLTQWVWKKMERKHWKRKIILNNNESSEEKETLYNTYPDFKKQPWVSLLSKSENRLSSFLEVLWRNMQVALEEQTRKTSPWVHRVWDAEEACGKEGGEPRGSGELWPYFWPLPPRSVGIDHSSSAALALGMNCRRFYVFTPWATGALPTPWLAWR